MDSLIAENISPAEKYAWTEWWEMNKLTCQQIIDETNIQGLKKIGQIIIIMVMFYLYWTKLLLKGEFFSAMF